MNFDIGIAVGVMGNTGGFNETISFDLIGVGVSTAAFLDERAGMRVQSIQGGTFTDIGSSKLLGDGTTDVPEPAPLLMLGAGLLGLGGLLVLRRRRHEVGLAST